MIITNALYLLLLLLQSLVLHEQLNHRINIFRDILISISSDNLMLSVDPKSNIRKIN
jgi:hypothetical protein